MLKETIQQSRRSGYSFKEGLTMMAAKDVGIDPYLAADAGEGAKAALNHLRKATKAKYGPARTSHIKDAQAELKSISAAKHPKLVNAIQAKLLALQGRGGDTEIAHLTPGEVVIPRSMQTPALMKQIAALAAQRGLNPAQLSVGHSANNINPKTGQAEFMEEVITIGRVGGGPGFGLIAGGYGSGYSDGRDHFDTIGESFYSPAPDFNPDDPAIPTLDVPIGTIAELLRKGYEWNGYFWVDSNGQRFKILEKSDINIAKSSAQSTALIPASLLTQINEHLKKIEEIVVTPTNYFDPGYGIIPLLYNPTNINGGPGPTVLGPQLFLADIKSKDKLELEALKLELEGYRLIPEGASAFVTLGTLLILGTSSGPVVVFTVAGAALMSFGLNVAIHMIEVELASRTP